MNTENAKNEINYFDNLNLNPLVRDRNLYDYVVLDSRFMYQFENGTAYKEIKNAETQKVEKVVYLGNRGLSYEAYKTIKPQLSFLAKQGYDKAIARYLFLEDPENWDAEIVAKAREIEKLDIKTPEQWEVVAHLHLSDEVVLRFDDEVFREFNFEAEKLGVKNMKDLYYQIRQYYNMFNECENEYHHRRYQDLYTSEIMSRDEFAKRVGSYYKKFLTLTKSMLVQCPKFVSAVRHAHVGYYARYFNGKKDILDLSSFMSLKVRPYSFLLPVEVIRKINGGKQYFNEHYGRFLKKDFKRMRRCKTISAHDNTINGYAVINGVDKIEGTCGFVDFARVGRKSRMTLSSLAKNSTTEEKKVTTLQSELVH